MGAADIVVHRAAAAEYEEAFAWYFTRSPQVATRFEHEVERALRLIVEAPTRWPACDAVHRRILLRRFPSPGSGLTMTTCFSAVQEARDPGVAGKRLRQRLGRVCELREPALGLDAARKVRVTAPPR